MKLDHQIAKSIQEYPDLYRGKSYEDSRLRVLSHLFITIENGFCWFDGYLTDQCKAKKMAPKYGVEKFTRPFGGDYFNDVIDMGDNSIETQWYPHPPCDGMSLNHIPDNVRLDWLAGADDICQASLKFYRKQNALMRDAYLSGSVTTNKHRRFIGAIHNNIRLLQRCQHRIKNLIGKYERQSHRQNISNHGQ